MITEFKNAAREKDFPVRDLSFLFIAINAKYVHTNLAVRYLKNNCKQTSDFCEYSINDEQGKVLADILKRGVKNLLFSCYIWNIEYILKLCEVIKKADSSVTITLGGPEVSFDAEELLLKYEYIDFIVCGEGEPALDLLTDKILSYSGKREVIKSDSFADLNKLAFPYENEDLSKLKGKILYYETSRGCPYRCAFCLSGASGKVRYLDINRVKREIDYFTENSIPLVKLVDRTFNSDKNRALEIVNYIKKVSKKTTFHFEIKAEIMTDEILESLATAPKGLFQVEIGVQSTNEDTLSGINRKSDFEKLSYVVRYLMGNDNINVHLDLIAGLPGESLESFIKSFNDVLCLYPHVLQLGFLKKLKGAEIKTEGSEFTSFPPYEVIASDGMSYYELLRLKKVEEVLEKYYNSGSFCGTMEYILKTYYKDNPFDFFDGLGTFFEENKKASVSKKEQFEILKKYCDENFKDENIENNLVLDYCRMYRDNLSFMKQSPKLKERAFEFLKITDNVNKYFHDHEEILPTQLYKKVRFCEVGKKMYVFDYIKNKYYDITEDMPKG